MKRVSLNLEIVDLLGEWVVVCAALMGLWLCLCFKGNMAFGDYLD